MKTIITCFVFMCAVAVSSVPAQAQIVIDTNDVKSQFAVGKSLTQYTDTLTTSLNIGNPGGGNTWVFTNLRLISPQVLTSVAPSGTPFIGQFAGSTHVLKAIATGVVIPQIPIPLDVTLYQYLRMSGNLLNPGNMAAASGLGGLVTGTLKTTNVNSDIFYKLPSTYQTTWTSTFTSTQLAWLNSDPSTYLLNTVTTHNARYVVDAYGTMQLPGMATGQPALRVRKIDVITKVTTPPSTPATVLSYLFLTKAGALVNITASDTSSVSGTITLGGSSTWNGPLPTAVGENANTPATFALRQNFPNPFNPSTRITYEVAAEGLVALRVYNLLGQEVTSLVNEVKSPGTYQLDWTPEGIPSGVYFYKLQSGSFTETRRMVFLK